MAPKIEEIDDTDDMPELEEDSTAETGAAPGVRGYLMNTQME